MTRDDAKGAMSVWSGVRNGGIWGDEARLRTFVHNGGEWLLATHCGHSAQM